MGLKYALGIDVGIASTGWGILELDDNGDPKRIVDAGSLIFEAAETPKTGEKKAAVRRGYRGVRRNLQRRKYRLNRVRNLLYDNGILFAKDMDDMLPSEREDYLTNVFNSVVENYYKAKKITPYEIKVKGLSKKLTNTELAIILCHWAKHRGYKSNREDDIVINETKDAEKK